MRSSINRVVVEMSSKRVLFMASLITLAVLLNGCAMHEAELPMSHAERIVLKSGQADPRDVCEHGFRKVYFFVQSEGRVDEPFAHWECLDERSVLELTRLNELAAESDEASSAEFARLRKKYSAEGWIHDD